MTKNSENCFTDQQLVQATLKGESRAFEAIIKKSERLVAQIIFKMVSNSSDRKDILQDVYMRVFNNLQGFTFQSKLSTWIASITYRACLSYLNRKKLVLIDDFFEGDLVTSGDIEHNLSNDQLAEVLKTEISSLSPIYQTLITLYHQEEMSYEEIAQITRLPEGTVKNYLFRARKELKKKLLKKYKGEDL